VRRVSVHQYISRTGGLYKTAQSGSFQRLKVKMVPEIPLILNGLSAVRKVPWAPEDSRHYQQKRTAADDQDGATSSCGIFPSFP